jgi:hypothetical protein
MCLEIFNLAEKIKKYQQNYLKHILRMPTYQIAQKILNYHPKGRRDRGQPPRRWKDQFAKLWDWNRPKALILVADDDEEETEVQSCINTFCHFKFTDFYILNI